MLLVENSSKTISKDYLKAPLYQQVVDWLRNEHKIHLVSTEDAGLYLFGIKWYAEKRYNEMYPKGGEYYEALNNAIVEALKLI